MLCFVSADAEVSAQEVQLARHGGRYVGSASPDVTVFSIENN